MNAVFVICIDENINVNFDDLQMFMYNLRKCLNQIVTENLQIT